VTVQLTDATTVAGTSWANLKSAAVAPGYDTSALSTEDQALIAALISAQNALGLSPLPTAPATVHIVTAGHTYSDSTTLSDGTTWADLKSTAMAVDYDVVATSLTEADKTLVTALIGAQAALLLNTDPLVPTEVTVDLTDATTVDGVAWTTLKVTATQSSYSDAALSTADKALVAALIAA
jgi:hypothetical protein